MMHKRVMCKNQSQGKFVAFWMNRFSTVMEVVSSTPSLFLDVVFVFFLFYLFIYSFIYLFIDTIV